MVPRGIIFLLVEGEVPETRKTTNMTLAAARTLILAADMNAIRTAHAKLATKSEAALTARDEASARQDWDAMEKAERAAKRHEAAELALYCAIDDAARLANTNIWLR